MAQAYEHVAAGAAQAVHAQIRDTVDKACMHRLVNAAVTGKRIEIDREARAVTYRYFVDVERVARQIGAYTRAQFLDDTDIYKDGFGRGAEVVHSLFQHADKRTLPLEQDWLTVAYVFGRASGGAFMPDGTPDEVRAFRPKIDGPKDH